MVAGVGCATRVAEPCSGGLGTREASDPERPRRSLQSLVRAPRGGHAPRHQLFPLRFPSLRRWTQTQLWVRPVGIRQGQGFGQTSVSSHDFEETSPPERGSAPAARLPGPLVWLVCGWGCRSGTCPDAGIWHLPGKAHVWPLNPFSLGSYLIRM